MHEHSGDLSRRRFLSTVTGAFSGVIALIAGVPVLGHLLGPITHPVPSVWIDLGPASGFPLGETRLVKFRDETSVAWAGLTSQTAVWVRHSPPDRFDVWAVNCTHLGCPVSWLPDAKLFECPCHGGIYYADGSVAAGPPPRPLFKHAVRIRDGVLQARSLPLPTD
ncbi:MAG: ubiquinol-cytochrome c reductase iron-sulfur subunit [Chloroflexota bacterium]|nr:ubiquinol-cytochrome c reductase iron-sulfur subunit [Chloroflexota bacterium]